MRHLIYFVLFIVSGGEKSLKIDIYPGFGWDHLRYLDMSPVYDVSNFNGSDVFQSCVDMIPLHENRIETGSVAIDTYNSQTNDYSSTWRIGGGGGYGGFRLSGSYSNEYQTIKQEQGEEKTITLRNHIDYLMVDVILQPSCPLHPQVKRDLIEIAKYVTTNRSNTATYAAQMFVKKYGTHIVSRLQLGGSINEDDFISYSTYQSNGFDKRLQKAAAEASFLGTFSLSASFSGSWSQSHATVNQYKQNIQRKVIHSKGGDVFILGTPMQSWQASVKSKPAIIRRAIENITYIIQSNQLPELTETALVRTREKIREAIEAYVDMNTIPGCMDRNSPSFNWIANANDGSCAPAHLTAFFGGFIQTCTEDTRMASRCSQYRISNFYTGNQECKSGFNRYLLHQTSQSESLYRRDCRACGFLWLSRCCEDVYIGMARRDIYLYGCNQNDASATSSGNYGSNQMHVFGGSFTTTKENPVTNAYSCSAGFSRSKGPGDITLCLAERISTNMNILPRYGGVYSCNYGNIANGTNIRGCSTGFSAFVMGAIDGGCLLYVCLKFETFGQRYTFPDIILPPFFELEASNSTIETNAIQRNGVITSRMIDSPYFDERLSSFALKIHRMEHGFSMIALIIAIYFMPFL